jgi:hypothetical protein
LLYKTCHDGCIVGLLAIAKLSHVWPVPALLQLAIAPCAGVSLPKAAAAGAAILPYDPSEAQDRRHRVSPPAWRIHSANFQLALAAARLLAGLQQGLVD